MSVQGVDSVLSQLRALQARSADLAPQPAAAGEGVEKGGFAAALGQALDSVNGAQQSARSVSTAFVQGEENVELADVMLALNKADVSFRTLAEVRNRMVSAYKDIMNMPV